ncbi:hypothetical protein D9Q98_001954 [Chlorella vulgaris]|uniref:Uncharacterized protein n=1 Tax=Chlorella vulgaris TaxID=3077 RepID=A0A9D4TVC2_CHLVU|nr:hypothetical protein D9Q98_001954 [Chlorella vulgaris]
MQTARLYPRARGGMSSQGPAAGIAFGGGRCLPPLHTRFSPSRAPVRCLASKSDKSWSEIAAEAAQLGTDLAKKVGSTVTNTVSKAVEALLPSDSPQSQEQKRESERLQRVESERRRQQDIFQPPEGAFGGGLMGGLLNKAVGSMLRSAVGALEGQLREAEEQTAEVEDRAARLITGSSKLRQRLGAVRVGPAMARSSSMTSINGRASSQVTLVLPVEGERGQVAQAQVQYVAGGSAVADQLSVAVQLPNGEVVELGGGGSSGSSGGSGQVIDVDWKSVDN